MHGACPPLPLSLAQHALLSPFAEKKVPVRPMVSMLTDGSAAFGLHRYQEPPLRNGVLGVRRSAGATGKITHATEFLLRG